MESAKYMLMHRDDEAAVLEFNQEDGYLFQVIEKKNEDLIPIRANRSTLDFRSWWNDRAVPRTQGSILSFLRELEIPTTQAYLLRNLGLGLNDHYWVRPEKSSLTWEAVNLFDNEFTSPATFHHRNTADSNAVTTFSPAASTGGELPKRWVVKDGKRYLIKESSVPLSQQSLNEVFASHIHEKQARFPFVSYSLARQSGSSKLACICECFTSNLLEYIPAWDLVGKQQRKDGEPLFDSFIKGCVAGGLKEESVRGYLDYQIVTDYLLSNTDRHLNNLGVLRDTHTLNYVSMAPIYDTGNSMFYNDPLSALSKTSLFFLNVNSFYSNERKLLARVNDFDCVDLNKMPERQDVETFYGKDQGLRAANFNSHIAIGYMKKLILLKELQKEKSLSGVLEKSCSRER
ncbi:excisionase [Parasphaerochaeta coccoides]|uniref:DNA binding domain protein, excisionase family n=1 Tax=Parasphaerochaeta coccoides (strain ATCC BAA-1237 / DSM 17374 / SPN1) TaxID=760011 RepID=F4GKM5_PARC1|nr:excisionase [Parasphaerochaeta coccoides]AEC01434.1 DNA binding domain protein, excisionase family [Parasphaerochaeta coccoides DSM 17374]